MDEAEALVAWIVYAWDAEKSDYANAKFIAACPQIVDELLVEIEQLRYEVLLMRKLLDIYDHGLELLTTKPAPYCVAGVSEEGLLPI